MHFVKSRGGVGAVFEGFYRLLSRRRIALILYALVCLLWVMVNYQGPYDYGDTGDYITRSPIRPPLYPWFLHLHFPTYGGWLETKPYWRAVMHTQLALIAISTFYFLWTLSRIRVWAPIVAILTFGALRVIKSHWGGILQWEIFYAILPEALKLAWFIALNAFVLECFFFPRRWKLGILGVVAYVGLELNPNALALGLIVGIPAIRLLERDVRTRLGYWLALPLVIYAGLYTARCAHQVSRGSTFSIVPFDGFTTITVSLQFAEPGMENLFADPKMRAFVAEMMKEPCRTLRRTPECKEPTAFWYELEAYRKVFPGETMDHYRMNRFFKTVSSVLLRQPKTFMRWQVWAWKNVGRGLISSPLLKLLWFAFAFFSLRESRRAWRRGETRALAIPAFYFVFLVNTFLATAFVVYDNRYIIYGEFLAIPAMLIALLLKEQGGSVHKLS